MKLYPISTYGSSSKSGKHKTNFRSSAGGLPSTVQSKSHNNVRVHRAASHRWTDRLVQPVFDLSPVILCALSVVESFPVRMQPHCGNSNSKTNCRIQFVGFYFRFPMISCPVGWLRIWSYFCLSFFFWERKLYIEVGNYLCMHLPFR